MAPVRGRLLVGNGTAWNALDIPDNDLILISDASSKQGIRWVEQTEAPVTFTSDVFRITADHDLSFDLSGLSADRALTVPDKDGTIALLSDLPTTEILTFTGPLRKVGTTVSLRVTPDTGLDLGTSLSVIAGPGILTDEFGVGARVDETNIVVIDNDISVSVPGLSNTLNLGGLLDHGSLAGLGDDDHPHYLTSARADALYLRRDNNFSDLDSTAEGRDNIGLGISNGFPNRTDSAITYDEGTRTITISPTGDSYEFWSDSTRYTKSAPLSLTWPDEDGLHHFYFDVNGDFVQVNEAGFDPVVIIGTAAYVANIYWNVTDQKVTLFGEERHGIDMDPTTHTYLHTTRGSVLVSGGAITTILTEGNGNTDDQAQIATSSLTFRDEDILFVATDDNPQSFDPILQAPVLYREGAGGYWAKSDANDFPLMYGGRDGLGGTRAYFNQLVGANWQLTQVGNNNFTLIHLFASNDPSNHYVIITGQAEYATVSDARAGAEVEILNLLTGDLPTAEYVALATIIVQTANSYGNTPGVRFRDTDTGDQYIDWRELRSSAAGGTALGDHGLLAGLGDDDHPQYVRVDGTRAMTGALDMGTNNITNVGTVDGRDVSVDGTTQDSHIADATIHYTQATIDHTVLLNVGSNTHAQIDTHIASLLNPHQVSLTQAYGQSNVLTVTTADGVFRIREGGEPPASLLVLEDSSQNAYYDFTNLVAYFFRTAIFNPSAGSAIQTVGDISVTGNITVTGTVDGRDVAADGTAQDSHIADATIHFAQGSIDHTAILNVGSNTHAQIDTHIADSTLHFVKSSIMLDDLGDVSLGEILSDIGFYYNNTSKRWTQLIFGDGLTLDTGTLNVDAQDHGTLIGLSDDDHTQYHTDARGDARYYQKTEFLSVSAGVGDAGKPVVLDAAGHVDASMINDGDIDHTAIANVGSNTHAQIDTHIADTTLHFTVASIDHTAILNVGSNTHAQIDTHIADSTVHFTVASIDHGSIAGLGDDDHTQYLLVSGTRAMSGDLNMGSNDITAAKTLSLAPTGADTGLIINSATGATGPHLDIIDDTLYRVRIDSAGQYLWGGLTTDGTAFPSNLDSSGAMFVGGVNPAGYSILITPTASANALFVGLSNGTYGSDFLLANDAFGLSPVVQFLGLTGQATFTHRGDVTHLIKGHSTQTNSPFRVETSAAATLLDVANDGDVVLTDGYVVNNVLNESVERWPVDPTIESWNSGSPTYDPSTNAWGRVCNASTDTTVANKLVRVPQWYKTDGSNSFSVRVVWWGDTGESSTDWILRVRWAEHTLPAVFTSTMTNTDFTINVGTYTADTVTETTVNVTGSALASDFLRLTLFRRASQAGDTYSGQIYIGSVEILSGVQD